MKKILLLPLMGFVAACGNTSVDAIPEIEVTSFASYAVQENGDVVLSGSDEVITITAEELATAVALDSRMGSEGSLERIIIDSAERYVAQSSDNVAVAAGARFLLGLPEDIYTGYGGIAGETVMTPTSGSTEYQGEWAAVIQTDAQVIEERFGNLTLNHSFEDNSITGAGFFLKSLEEVLSIDAVAGVGGDITGTVTYDDAFAPFTRTGDLTAGFFGEGTAEIAGVFIGEGIAGTMLADRQPEEVVSPE